VLSPSEVVDLQLNAYNSKNIEGFMKYWHPEAEYYSHPNALLLKGVEEIRKRHIERFQEPELFGKLMSRVQIDDRVIDHEVVTRSFPEGRGSVEVICIYEVKNEKITKAWFIMGNKKIDGELNRTMERKDGHLTN